MTRWHYADLDTFWTLCRLWADAVNTTGDRRKVNCPTCMTKMDEPIRP